MKSRLQLVDVAVSSLLLVDPWDIRWGGGVPNVRGRCGVGFNVKKKRCSGSKEADVTPAREGSLIIAAR